MKRHALVTAVTMIQLLLALLWEINFLPQICADERGFFTTEAQKKLKTFFAVLWDSGSLW